MLSTSAKWSAWALATIPLLMLLLLILMPPLPQSLQVNRWMMCLLLLV
jgi:Flp pilus assembly protein TadB